MGYDFPKRVVLHPLGAPLPQIRDPPAIDVRLLLEEGQIIGVIPGTGIKAHIIERVLKHRLDACHRSFALGGPCPT